LPLPPEVKVSVTLTCSLSSSITFTVTFPETVSFALVLSKVFGIASSHLFISYQDDSPSIFSFIDEERVFDFALNVLGYLKKENWDVSLHFCFDPFIQELNKTYRNIDSPTDVLSFEMGESYVDEDGEARYVAGDIVISVDTLKKNANYFSVSENEELKRLIIHSILHLSGMDHSDNSKDQPMLILQEDILKLFSNVEIIKV